ncbi:MAG: hypothetical protein LUC48_00505 [Clostridiales bacterium]|nr:hypothetical protein [Clostridiales bacterium]
MKNFAVLRQHRAVCAADVCIKSCKPVPLTQELHKILKIPSFSLDNDAGICQTDSGISPAFLRLFPGIDSRISKNASPCQL